MMICSWTFATLWGAAQTVRGGKLLSQTTRRSSASSKAVQRRKRLVSDPELNN
jgi:hypothetical protein